LNAYYNAKSHARYTHECIQGNLYDLLLAWLAFLPVLFALFVCPFYQPFLSPLQVPQDYIQAGTRTTNTWTGSLPTEASLNHHED